MSHGFLTTVEIEFPIGGGRVIDRFQVWSIDQATAELWAQWANEEGCEVPAVGYWKLAKAHVVSLASPIVTMHQYRVERGKTHSAGRNFIESEKPRLREVRT